MRSVVRSVACILALGLISDMLKANAIAIAAYVAHNFDGIAFGILLVVGAARGTSVAQLSKFGLQPHCLALHFGKPPAMSVMGPQQGS